MSLINDILDILNDKNKKQSELCAYLDINTSTMTNWKNRNTDPPSKYIIPICEFLGVTPYYLLTGKEKGTESFENIPEQELIESYRKLSDFEKGEVLGDVKRRAANAEQVKKPNIQRVYQAAITYNREPIPTVIEADITPLLEAPDATDEY